ncbi:MAG: chromate transporter, partial [Lawsonibacter sp.]
VALIASSVLKLGKSTVKDGVTVCIFLVVLGLAFFTGLSPVLLILGAGLAGYVARRLAGLAKGGEGA